MPRLVISLPTRGRPQQLIETVKRNISCLSLPDTVVMVQADTDDGLFSSEIIRDLLAIDSRVRVSARAREDTIAAKWNRALEVEADAYVCLAVDDPLIFERSDEKILAAASLFPDGVGMVYGRMANASFSSTICFTKRMTQLLGYIQPEYFPYWFCDHWTDDIGRMIGRIIMADVATLQCVDRSKVGRTQEMREPGWWATWFDANYMVRREHAHHIIDQLDEPEWRKEMQKSIAPLTEYRSRLINDNVRQTEKMEGFGTLLSRSLKEERYVRIKQKAIEAVPVILATLPETEARIYRDMLTPPTTIQNLQRAYG